jgi:hypothetical protein
MEELMALSEPSPKTALLKVKDLWTMQTPPQRWRQWKTSHQELGVPETIDLQSWQAQANSRKILFREGPDILRWGHSTAGTFTCQGSLFFARQSAGFQGQSISGIRYGIPAFGPRSPLSYGWSCIIEP